MPSDYRAIAHQNQLDYGLRVKDYGTVLLQLLYSDRTHFIFELLQNAEDAGAQYVRFRLHRDRLEVQHDGRAFNAQDVLAICGIVAGTKSDDLTTIGRFGIGFKSVYAYTAAPEIHSADEHFCVHDYVYPKAVPAVPLPDGETHLIFPFNHSDVSPDQAFSEIGRRLKQLGARPLLFLQHIKEIDWAIEGDEYGTYLREPRVDAPARRITLIGEDSNTDESVDEQWLVFSRGISGHSSLKVEVAYLLESGSGPNEELVLPVTDSRLVVFFPTEKETHLGFLVQGPYRTTPSRDNVPTDDTWNRELVQTTADLVVESLPQLRRRNLLTVSTLQAMPIREIAFPDEGMFRPIFDAVLQALRTQPLLPTQSGTFVAANGAVLTNSSAIRDLVDEKQLGKLLDNRDPLAWLSDEITPSRTPALWTYLANNLGIQEIDGEGIVRHITGDFLASQGDDWMARFYAFLLDQKALWKSLAARRQQVGPLREKPIIRLDDGVHVLPYAADGKPNAYISNEVQDQIPIVSRSILAVPEARAFLEAIGLKEPDPVETLIRQVLPKYGAGRVKWMSAEEHRRDIDQIFRTLRTVRGRRDVLVQHLREAEFLVGHSEVPRREEYMAPGNLYFRTSDLECYFQGNGDAWFIDERYEPYGAELRELGVQDKVRVWKTPSDPQGFVKFKADSPYQRGLARFAPDIEVDGLRHALTFPTFERSNFVWNTLLPVYARHIEGEIEESTRKTFTDPTRRWDITEMGRILRTSRWLPASTGAFHAPSEITADDLPTDFSRNAYVSDQLKMQSTVLAEHLREVGLTVDEVECIRANREEFEAWRLSMLDGDVEPGPLDDEVQPFSFATELQKIFKKPVPTVPNIDPIPLPNGNVPDPELRRERVDGQISEDQENELRRVERFKRVPTKVWNKKDNRARDFLRQEYRGRCQVCNGTFLKRDGSSYFEGMYLVSRTKASWIDREGNVLCLCANCCAKLMHGSLKADDIVEQAVCLRLREEGGTSNLAVHIILCGEPAQIQFTERHLLDLQQLIGAREAADSS